jgi:hypothetical protein
MTIQIDLGDYLDVLDSPALIVHRRDVRPDVSTSKVREEWAVLRANQHVSEQEEASVLHQLARSAADDAIYDYISLDGFIVTVKALHGGRTLVITTTASPESTVSSPSRSVKKVTALDGNGDASDVSSDGTAQASSEPGSHEDGVVIHSRRTESSLARRHEVPGLILPTRDNRDPWSHPLPSPIEDDRLQHNEYFLSYPWHETDLGPITIWPTVLKATVQHMMDCPYPVLVAWGPRAIMLYNLPYRRSVGKKHPFILGRPYSEAWSEVWDTLQPLTERAFKGEVVVMEKQELFLNRLDSVQGERAPPVFWCACFTRSPN